VPRTKAARPAHRADGERASKTVSTPRGNNLEPTAASGAAQTIDAGDARLRLLARRLHRLGERPVYEFIREILAGADPVERLEAYARLDPAIVKYLGADRMREDEYS
jgi:hypothetical protein